MQESIGKRLKGEMVPSAGLEPLVGVEPTYPHYKCGPLPLRIKRLYELRPNLYLSRLINLPFPLFITLTLIGTIFASTIYIIVNNNLFTI